MANETTDPFTLVHRKLWSGLTGYAPWAQAATGHKMRFDQQPYPSLLDMPLQPADSPMVALLQSALDLRPHAYDAGDAAIAVGYPLVVVGADMNVVPVNAIVWQTLRALVALGPYLQLPRLVRAVTVTGGGFDLRTSKEWKAKHGRARVMATINVASTIAREYVLAGAYPAAL